MLTKLRVGLIGAVAALFLLGAAAPAFAQSGAGADASAPSARIRWEGGVVTALSADGFTATGLRGVERTIAVTASTLYFDQDAQPISLADVQVGDRVRGALKIGDDGTLTALLIVDAGPQTEYRGVGVATGVDADEQSFAFTNRRGRDWEFYVDDATEITNRAGADLSFADLAAGEHLFVRAELRDDGQWWAVRIGVGMSQ